MDITKAYLKAAPWEALVEMINDNYYFQLSPTSTTLTGFQSLSTTLTRFTIAVNRSEHPSNLLPVVDRTEFTYNRFNLSTFFDGTTVIDIEGLTLPSSTFAAMQVLAKQNDIVLDLDDFYNEAYTEYNTEFVVVANPKSLRWVGQLRIRLVNTTRVDLANTGSIVEFPNVNKTPWPSTGQIQGLYYVTAFDFTEYRETLLPITRTTQYPTTAALAAILKNVTGQPWVSVNGIASHNLAHAVIQGETRYKVHYNGPCLPHYTARKDISRVLVLELSENHCSDVTGYLLVHYN